MHESQDDLTRHRIGLVPRLIDRKACCAQQIEKRLRIGPLRKDEKIHIVRGTRNSPDAER